MDELAAAAAAVAMAIDDYAEADVEQRALCGDDDGRDGCGLAVEDTEADKEINGGDAASGDIEDVILGQVSFAPKVPWKSPCV